MKTLIAALFIGLSSMPASIAADFSPSTQPDCEQKACPIGNNGQPSK